MFEYFSRNFILHFTSQIIKNNTMFHFHNDLYDIFTYKLNISIDHYNSEILISSYNEFKLIKSNSSAYTNKS